MELERLKTALEKLEDPRRTVGGHILHMQKKRFAAALDPDRFLSILFAKL